MGGLIPTIEYHDFKELKDSLTQLVGRIERLEAKLRELEDNSKSDPNPFGQDGYPDFAYQ